eukprot:TRINITY_DN132499_c0_g2_i1.p1 TRINITY_DN132499_c0_g2~~TRINITY_DN132499_c0_g2_i1.p1  ORF type:complete len:523 (+),score=90.93 TRINITY_DN132499_c0_g2_i1:160-1728(+)
MQLSGLVPVYEINQWFERDHDHIDINPDILAKRESQQGLWKQLNTSPPIGEQSVAIGQNRRYSTRKRGSTLSRRRPRQARIIQKDKVVVDLPEINDMETAFYKLDIENSSSKSSRTSNISGNHKRHTKKPISGLTRALKSPDSLKEHAMGPREKIVLFLPDQSKIVIKAATKSTVTEIIDYAIKAVNMEVPGRLFSNAACYDLRLHDEDGIPDEDFPALDRGRAICHFKQGAIHEYCLCVAAGRPVIDTSPGSNGRTNSTSSVISDQRYRLSGKSNIGNPRTVKVLLPNFPLISTLNIPISSSQMTVGDLLLRVIRHLPSRAVISDFDVKYIAEDLAELGCAGSINLNTELRTLGVESLVVEKRKYADAPTRPRPMSQLNKANLTTKPTPQTGREVALQKLESEMVTPEAFVFDGVDGSKYQEWKLIKINKRGRRQERTLGVDFMKIYNKRSASLVFSVRRSNRYVSTLKRVLYDASIPRDIKLEFIEDGVVEILHYEAPTVRMACEIVAKIRFVLSLEKHI